MLRSAGSSSRQADTAELAADFAELEVEFVAAISKRLLGQLAVAGPLFAALKFFWRRDGRRGGEGDAVPLLRRTESGC